MYREQFFRFGCPYPTRRGGLAKNRDRASAFFPFLLARDAGTFFFTTVAMVSLGPPAQAPLPLLNNRLWAQGCGPALQMRLESTPVWLPGFPDLRYPR